ncbi:MAG: class I SAM-dependent methyltransferase [Candidatus Thorarchaeota archaeon]|nr:class I SAM-dependent methyltransferase [Candidatus Thorarchaeota archaeon]
MPDTFGKIMRDAVQGHDSSYIIERDDGFIRNTSGLQYIRKFDEWPRVEQLAVEEMEGPVLDIGCGVCRVGEILVERGLEYYGIDTSPLAIEISRKRGFNNVYEMSADKLVLPHSYFKTVVLFGNNFRLMGQPEGVVRMLRGFHDVTTDDAKILGGSIDPLETGEEIHLKYHEMNREAGNPPGLVRLRNKYKGDIDDWWYLLLCTKELMKELGEQAGWYLEKTIGEPKYYVGILKKTH